MRQIIIAISFLLVCFSMSFGQTASINDNTFNIANDKWPKCLPPQADFFRESNEGGFIVIYNSEPSIKYDVKVQGYNDQIYFDYKGNTEIDYKKDSQNKLFIRSNCGKFGVSEWVEVLQHDDESRTSSCYDESSGIYFHYKQLNETTLLIAAFDNGNSINPNAIYTDLQAYNLKFDISRNGEIYSFVSNHSIGELVDVVSSNVHVFVLQIPGSGAVTEVKTSVGNLDVCTYEGNLGGCSSFNHTCDLGGTVYSYYSNPSSIKIYQSAFNCQQDYSAICTLNDKVIGARQGTNLLISTPNLTLTEFNYIRRDLIFSTIYIRINGDDANGISHQEYIEYCSSSNEYFNPQTWQYVLPEFGQYSNIEVSLFIGTGDESGHDCNNFVSLPMQEEITICSFADNLKGIISGDNLVLSFDGISQIQFDELVQLYMISDIEFEIWGSNNNSHQAQTENLVLFNNVFTPLDVENWTYNLVGFGNYDNISYSMKYTIDGIQKTCRDNLILNPDNPICNLFSIMKGVKGLNSSVKFSFHDDTNNQYLNQSLQNLGFNVSTANAYIQSSISSLKYTLSYNENGNDHVKTTIIPINQNFDINTLNFSFQVESFLGFVGNLNVEYTTIQNSIHECYITQVIIDESIIINQDLPDLSCNPLVQNETSLSQIPYSFPQGFDLVGTSFTMNGIPVIISQITSGNNILGINGFGLCVIPFKNKRLEVALQGVKINVDSKGYSGSILGKNGPNLSSMPTLPFPPLVLGGDICLPPPSNDGILNGDGLDANGYNGYGFNPNTGIHKNGTPFDDNNFDINGNFKDTGKPYNDEGCSRDGYKYEPDENGEMALTNKPCDPSGGTPSGLNDWIAGKEVILPNLLQIVYNDELTKHSNEVALQAQKCDIIRPEINTNEFDHSELLKGLNNELVLEDMSQHFISEPKGLEINGTISSQYNILQTKHIALYQCDVILKKNKSKQSILLAYGSELSFIEKYIGLAMRDLKKVKFDELKNSEEKYKIWVDALLMTYIRDNSDYHLYGNLNSIRKLDNYFYPDENTNSGYYNTCDIDSKEKDNRDRLANMAFQYDQGFKVIDGYERPIVTQMWKEAQISYFNMVDNVENQLPISYKYQESGYELEFLFTNVIINPTNCRLDAALVATDIVNKYKIAFAADNLSFNAGGFSSAKLLLANEIKIRLFNGARMNIKPLNTFVEFDCNGFKEAKFTSGIEFCRNDVVPLDDNLNPISDPEVRFEVLFSASMTKWMSFTASASSLHGFELTRVKGIKFERFDIYVDFDEKVNITNMTFPSGYPTVGGDWTGVYIKTFSAAIPKLNVTIGAYNCIFDKNGFSGTISGGTATSPLLPFAQGNLGGWRFSIETLNLSIFQNQVIGGGLGGDVGVPVFEKPITYTGTISTLGFEFKAGITSVEKFKIFGDGKLTLTNGDITISDIGDAGFKAEAKLSGSVDLELLGGVIKLTKLRFEGFEVSNKSPLIDLGKWSPDNPKDGDKANMNIGPVQIFSFYPRTITNDEAALRIDLGVNVIDSIVSARGRIDIKTKMTLDNENIQHWGFNGIEVQDFCIHASLKEIVRIDACLMMFDENTPHLDGVNYGKGWSGYGEIKLTGLGGFGIQSAMIFGKVNGEDYYFVDGAVKLGEAVTVLGVINLKSIGGGLARGMVRNTDNLTNVVNITNSDDYFNAKLGTSLTGIRYEPSTSAGIEFKFFTTFNIIKDELANGSGELVFKLAKADHHLIEVEFLAKTRMITKLALSDFLPKVVQENIDAISGPLNNLVNKALPSSFDSIPKPDDIEAKISGYMKLVLNFDEPSFTGRIAAYLDAGIIHGTGKNNALVSIDLVFNPKEWYIYVGTPQSPCGAEVNLALIKIRLSSYFDIGSVIPPFPGLPPRVAHLGSSFKFNEGLRGKGGGFAFGAAFDVDVEGKFLGTGMDINVGAGFDLQFKRFEDVKCANNNKLIGVDGWYARGQLWAYITGEISLFWVNIIEAGLAAVFQFQGPNPTYMHAALEVYYESFFGDGKWEGSVEVGDYCRLTSSNPSNLLNLDIFDNVYPTNGEEDVDIKSSIDAIFTFNLKKGISNYDWPEGPSNLSFLVDKNNTGIFDMNGNRIEAKLTFDDLIKKANLTPSTYLQPLTKYYTKFTVNVVAQNGPITKNFVFERLDTFTTSEKYLSIEPSNLESQFPIDGMTNYYYLDNDFEKGFIKLKRAQPALFNPKERYNDDNEIVKDVTLIRITDGQRNTIFEEIAYDFDNNVISFNMPNSFFNPNTLYRISVVKFIGITERESPPLNNQIDGGNNTAFRSDMIGITLTPKELYSMYFRTSKYAHLADKIFDLEADYSSLRNDNISAGLREKTATQDLSLIYSFETGEIFDGFELYGTSVQKKLLRITPKNLMYDIDLSKKVYAIAGGELFEQSYDFTNDNCVKKVLLTDSENQNRIWQVCRFSPNKANNLNGKIFEYMVTKENFDSNKFTYRSGLQTVLYTGFKFSALNPYAFDSSKLFLYKTPVDVFVKEFEPEPFLFEDIYFISPWIIREFPFAPISCEAINDIFEFFQIRLNK